MICTAALVGFCLTAQISAPSETDRLKAEVQQLVEELDDSARSTRERAEKQLVKKGPNVLTLLPRTTDKTPAEVKQRLDRIRRTLELVSADQNRSPSRLTFQGTFPLAEILAGIEKQTGNRVVDYRDRFGQAQEGLQLELDIQDQPFWQALDEILDQAGLTIYSYVGQTRTIGVVAAGPNDRKRKDAGAYSGLFRIEAAEIIARRNLISTDNRSLQLRLELLWEPRTAPILLRHALADLALEGDHGEKMSVISPDGTLELPVQSTLAGIDLVLPLQLPDRKVRKISKLSGEFTAMIPGLEEKFEFQNLDTARNVTQKKGGLTVTLERVRKNGSLLECRIRVKFENPSDALQSHLDWASNNQVYLIDGQGKRIDNPNFERYLERSQEVGFAYLFPLGDEEIANCKLVYQSPAGMIDVPIKYTLTDIELP
ncbi:MAG: hypothetical protein GY768_12640 [Planctomycetaceae bacterium]|nr:hypothetical protein [Planctomycetaceae bacterium]